MTAKIALQLYTVREAMAKDIPGVLRRVAEAGYAGVETAGFADMTPEEMGKMVRDLGLEVASMHAAPPVGDDKQAVLEAAAALGCSHLVSGKGPDDFKTLDLIAQTCELFNEGAAVARANGLRLSVHNHWWEFGEIDGRRVYQVMLEHLSPDVLFEVDVYWVQTGGCDPATVLRELGPRARLLHMKDGPCKTEVPMVALGEGNVDLPAVVEASGGNAEWLIVELDECATDMFEAVEKSYRYLAGLA